MNTLIIISALIALAFTATQAQSPDSIVPRFERQLQLFPQEKIYLHTDKPYYLSGETIWFRAHVADAATHKPANASRYVYVELIDPLDSVRVRLKVRPDSTGAHSGSLLIPEVLPEGNYELRAFTRYMENAGEDYFFSRSVHILCPQSATIQTNARFEFETKTKVTAEIRLLESDKHQLIKPDKVKVTVDNYSFNATPEKDGVLSFSFRLPENGQRTLLLETVSNKGLFRKFIDIVDEKNEDFDISFYPEGGNMLSGTTNRIAFKAMRSTGQSASVSGKIFDNNDIEVAEFKTEYNGMGCVSLNCEAGKSYYAISSIDGKTSKRFELPKSRPSGCMLTSDWHNEKLFISIRKTNDIKNELYLTAHTRGIVHFTVEWEPERKSLVLAKEIFPSGVLQLLLLDSNMNPLSERLVFINNNDQAQARYSSDKVEYNPRSLVENHVSFTTPDSSARKSNFSVSVTEDKEVKYDSTANILTTLLLTSDLRGRIDNPEFYFQNNPKSTWLLDLLLMTQGWRRYDIPQLICGKINKPTIIPEIETIISGSVRTINTNKVLKGQIITAVGRNVDYAESAITDEKGKFILTNSELPDLSVVLISAVSKSGRRKAKLTIDEYQFNVRKTLAPPQNDVIALDNLLDEYVDKAEQKYINEGGERTNYIEEVIISAERPGMRKSVYYSEPSVSLTEEQIERRPMIDMTSLLRRIPGVRIFDAYGIEAKNDMRAILYGMPIINHNLNHSYNFQKPPLLVIDDIPQRSIYDIWDVDPYNVAQIDVLKGPKAMVFGSDGIGGVFIIFTKKGKVLPDNPAPNIKLFRPLGYHRPAAFYSPKYDTPEARANPKPDLRTTIYWNPSITTDSTGHASFSFYTADTESTYTVTIEGLAEDGRIIHKVGKINVKKQ